MLSICFLVLADGQYFLQLKYINCISIIRVRTVEKRSPIHLYISIALLNDRKVVAKFSQKTRYWQNGLLIF